jgi:hypothetical protein
MTTENIRSGVRRLVCSLRSGMELRSMYVRTRFFATELCLSINGIWTRTASICLRFSVSTSLKYTHTATVLLNTELYFVWPFHGVRANMATDVELERFLPCVRVTDLHSTFTHTSPSSRMLRFHNKLKFNTIWTFKQAFKKLVHCGSFWWPWFLVNLHLQVSSWWHLAANGSKLYLSLCTKPDGTHSDF